VPVPAFVERTVKEICDSSGHHQNAPGGHPPKGQRLVVSNPAEAVYHVAPIGRLSVAERHQFTRRGRCNGVVPREKRMRPRSECNAWFGQAMRFRSLLPASLLCMIYRSRTV